MKLEPGFRRVTFATLVLALTAAVTFARQNHPSP